MVEKNALRICCENDALRMLVGGTTDTHMMSMMSMMVMML